jgi:hypothetical protein
MNKLDELLRNIAIDCLRKANLNPQLALKEFIEEVRDAGGLMCELHSAADSERAGLEYLERVARSMETRGTAALKSGLPLKSRPSTRDVGYQL